MIHTHCLCSASMLAAPDQLDAFLSDSSAFLVLFQVQLSYQMLVS